MRVLRVVPKGAIFCVADALQKLLERVIREGTPYAWGRLSSFCYVALGNPGHCRGEAKRNTSLSTVVKRQVTSFMEDEQLIIPVRDV